MHSIANDRCQSVTEITDHLGEIRDRVRNALHAAGRPGDDALIVAVSKGHPAAAIEEAYLAGQRHFGESYVQEAIPKMEQLRHLAIEWHFLGRLQANKTRAVAAHFQWVHTLDRLKVAARLSEQRPHYAAPLNVLLQVNQTGEPSKAGVAEREAAALARDVARLPRLALRGLMCFPPAVSTPSERAALFGRMRALEAALIAEGLPLETLSMGMSNDFEAAIAAGSTCVRIGSAIFGARPSR